MDKKKHILSVAGFDPSSGAGLTSDIKTFEAHHFYGLSVCTAVTVQNDMDFKNCHWVPTSIILEQIETLFERFEVNIVKIGIVENWTTLLLILNKLHALNSEVKIVLDPIIKASAGFDFHSQESQDLLDEIWKQCYIITPNYDEIQLLYPHLDIEETLEHISSKTNIYLKGGHRTDKKGWDELYHSGIVMVNIQPNTEKVFEKHGSGCVLSSSLACNIALGQELEDAARSSKHYTEQFLNSSEGLLGVHKYGIQELEEFSSKKPE
ncbi:hydroxymethylpyrimidine/phosphomethylpyrimidine kinase [Wenyingzhuangia marina]|uniref:hydroxymethylpyrimidine kinase n=1 Tax=Wenyingzhuangia marina TaxID=1195760 RepID=A0A1M5TA65_9FLAO|nr:hydroxymethylpyrimidine/phosphomethylpyrimidine kinase [Wenyingzhuangia marina]GGF66007.1 hydroxymethylpyrimidine/phosphomethylpyrimidine kinase [Wenyingzhuangia marina]SHH47675.1 hydroxymethylpyrimidine/phosphomethylpyrimidine kinase [Wenyingzhuangia marina]